MAFILRIKITEFHLKYKQNQAPIHLDKKKFT